MRIHCVTAAYQGLVRSISTSSVLSCWEGAALRLMKATAVASQSAHQPPPEQSHAAVGESPLSVMDMAVLLACCCNGQTTDCSSPACAQSDCTEQVTTHRLRVRATTAASFMLAKC